MHDNSKINCEDEFLALAKIIQYGGKMSTYTPLSPSENNFTKLHQKHNSHHVEFYKTPYDMSRLDLMEFACDICARSEQKGTDVFTYLESDQEKRFHFPNFMYEEIKFYCSILKR